MAFRDELDAAHARNQALERRIAELETANAELRGGPSTAQPEPLPEPRKQSVLVLFLVAALLALIAATAVFYGQSVVAAVTGLLALALCVQTIALRSLVHIAGPHTALVITGRQYRGPGGQRRGFRVVTGGRVVAMPLFETVERLDLRGHPVTARVASACARDNQPVTLELAAEVRIARREPVITHAIERFLGRSMDDVTRVAAETIEGHARALVATLTAAEIEEGRDKLAEAIAAGSAESMQQLGLEIDRLSIKSR